MTNARECLEVITTEGREITINIEIKDSEKAERLLGTMYGKPLEEFGVSVTSWGFWDITKANKLRLDMLEQENIRHQVALGNIRSMTDRAILEEDDDRN